MITTRFLPLQTTCIRCGKALSKRKRWDRPRKTNFCQRCAANQGFALNIKIPTVKATKRRLRAYRRSQNNLKVKKFVQLDRERVSPLQPASIEQVRSQVSLFCHQALEPSPIADAIAARSTIAYGYAEAIAKYIEQIESSPERNMAETQKTVSVWAAEIQHGVIPHNPLPAHAPEG